MFSFTARRAVRGLTFAARGRHLVALLPLLLLGCRDELRPNMCERTGDCPAGTRCEVDGGPDFLRCVPIDLERDAGGDTRDAPTSSDTHEVGVPASNDTSAGDAGVAPVMCTASADCKDPSRPLCKAGQCTGCATPDAGTCPAPLPVCDPATGACVACLTHGECTDPARPLCANRQCTTCTSAGGNPGCLARAAARPICAPSGRCIECGVKGDCRVPGKPFCLAEICTSCVSAGANACPGATPVCNPATGACSACLADTDCKDVSTPFCMANTCVGCNAVAAGGCAARAASLPACGPAGACVQCNTSSDCTFDPLRPICNPGEHTCRACGVDSECASRSPAGPGVCLDHRGGRCATDAETIFVTGGAGCGPGMGTRAVPLCAPGDALALVTAARALIVLRGPLAAASWSLPTGTPALTVVGQGAVITGGSRSGLRLDGPAELLVRGLTVTGSVQPGIVATGRVGLTLRDSALLANPGGGLLVDSARFELRNVLVEGNGVGQTGPTSWGGMLVLGDLTPRTLDQVTIKNNKLLGLACYPNPITAHNSYVKQNGVPGAGEESQAQPTCAITSCTTEGGSCGASVMRP